MPIIILGSKDTHLFMAMVFPCFGQYSFGVCFNHAV